MWQSNIFRDKVPPLVDLFCWCLQRRNHTSNRQYRWPNFDARMMRNFQWLSCFMKKWKPRSVSFLLSIFLISKIIWCELWRPISRALISSILVRRVLVPQQPTCMTYRTVHMSPCQVVPSSRTAYSCIREIRISNFGLAKFSRKLLCGFSQSVHTDASIVRVAIRKWHAHDQQ